MILFPFFLLTKDFRSFIILDNRQKSNNFFYFQGACGWWKQVVEGYEVGLMQKNEFETIKIR